MNGKQYWWCPTHKMWCRHKPQDCKGLGYRPGQEIKHTEESTPASKELKVKQALKVIMESDGNESE